MLADIQNNFVLPAILQVYKGKMSVIVIAIKIENWTTIWRFRVSSVLLYYFVWSLCMHLYIWPLLQVSKMKCEVLLEYLDCECDKVLIVWVMNSNMIDIIVFKLYRLDGLHNIYYMD